MQEDLPLARILPNRPVEKYQTKNEMITTSTSYPVPACPWPCRWPRRLPWRCRPCSNSPNASRVWKPRGRCPCCSDTGCRTNWTPRSVRGRARWPDGPRRVGKTRRKNTKTDTLPRRSRYVLSMEAMAAPRPNGTRYVAALSPPPNSSLTTSSQLVDYITSRRTAPYEIARSCPMTYSPAPAPSSR